MDPAPAPLRRTPLWDEHRRLGGRLVPFAGWEMPVQYRGVVEEHKAVRTAVGIFDVSHMGEVEMRGRWAEAVVDWLVTGDVKSLRPGHALYTTACNEQGGILDDLIVYRMEPERILTVCNASNREKIAAHFRKAAEGHCEFEDRSDGIALIALQGPRAMGVLGQAGPDAAACAALPKFGFAEAAVAGVRVTVARTGYTGEDGVEIFAPWDEAPAVWRLLVDLGAGAGIQPTGLGARDTLRLECKMALYGNDIDETTNPLEAGLGWTVKLDKGEFVGRAAIEAVRRDGVRRKLVGFEMTGRGIARHGYALLDASGGTAGTCTSGSPSPTLGKNIGLGYLPPALAAVGTTLRVDCRGKPVDAVVVKTPFYKRAS